MLMNSTSCNMDLIPTVSFFELLAAIPLVMVLGPFVVGALVAFMEHPLVQPILNTTLVILKTTEVVWRPAVNFAVVLLKPIVKALVRLAPIVKDLVLFAMNTTVTAFRTAQKMGLSFASAFPSFVQGMKDIGEALITLVRGMGNMMYYILRATSLVVGSVESVFVFGKRLLFEAHLLTVNDVYNVALPFIIVTSLIGFLYWFRKAPQKDVQVFQPRRSSRLARKRAMMYASDISDALSSCKKSSATATNL